MRTPLLDADEPAGMDVALDDTRYARHVADLRARLDEELKTLVPLREPAALYEPIRYVLDGQGKRLRPLLLLLAAEAFGASSARALPAALAVEVFHSFTLVHDDIMDHADERRGRPTVHVAWDQDTAILCGDYLMMVSYDLLARVETPRLPVLLRVFSAMVARLCEGQTLDKSFETRHDVSVEAYLAMIDAKTGALLEAALELGGLIGEAGDEDRAALRAVGHEMGRAFQIQDDLLDLVADDARWGKPIGGDLMEGKRTLLLLEALERAEGAERDWFARILQGGLPADEVDEARVRMDRLGVLETAREAVSRHSRHARAHLDALPQGEAAEILRWLIHRMQARLH